MCHKKSVEIDTGLDYMSRFNLRHVVFRIAHATDFGSGTDQIWWNFIIFDDFSSFSGAKIVAFRIRNMTDFKMKCVVNFRGKSTRVWIDATISFWNVTHFRIKMVTIWIRPPGKPGKKWHKLDIKSVRVSRICVVFVHVNKSTCAVKTFRKYSWRSTSRKGGGKQRKTGKLTLQVFQKSAYGDRVGRKKFRVAKTRFSKPSPSGTFWFSGIRKVTQKCVKNYRSNGNS